MQHAQFKLITLAVLVSVFSSCSINKALEKQYQKVAKAGPYDAIIVPGTPIGDKGLESIFTARIWWAKYLYDNKVAKNIIFSGGAVHTPYVEGAAMKIYADSIGIPSNHTFAETKAKHSSENAYYGLKVAKKLGFKKVALSTDIFQTMMLNNFLKKRCERMVSIPIVFNRIFKDKKQIEPLPVVDLSSAKVDENEFIPLGDKENFFQRMKGTLGLQINYEETESIIDPTSQACEPIIVGSN
jgi:uncharacterized SAM-binding protein YcdF (DUF218 family)